MDVATLIGILASFGLVAYSVLSGEGASTFINIPAILIVLGGTVGATLVCFPLNTLFSVLGVVRKTFFFSGTTNDELIGTLETLATRARKEGLLSLQQASDEVNDSFYQTGLQLVIDGQEADTIEQILQTEIQYLGQRHSVGAELMKTMGTYAPAFGMIGTIIGLIQMLQSMNDPSTIGPAMAVALITTFYGAVMANLAFLPIAGKLRSRSQEELLYKELTMEGVLSISLGDNPRIVEQKLISYLEPRLRAMAERK